MDWLLILTMTLSGQSVDVRAGRMLDQRICIIAGAGMAAIIEQANPGLVVGVTCQHEASA